MWRFGQVDAATGQRFVTTGGVQGNPGVGTIDNWFKIERFESAYKIVYCPTVCESCEVECKDVGIFLDDDRNTRFVLISRLESSFREHVVSRGIPISNLGMKTFPTQNKIVQNSTK
ncbi:Miraculin [Glycine soja]